MDRNIREKEFLCHMELVKMEDIKESFTEINYESKSYFVTKEEKEYLMEYNFDSLPQLKEILNLLWKKEECMQGIIPSILVAAMKNKPAKVTQEVSDIKNSEKIEGELPAFIYNF